MAHPKVLKFIIKVSVIIQLLALLYTNNDLLVRAHLFNITDLNLDSLLPTETLSTSDLVERAGYVPLVHNIPTQKGYVINLVRIVNPLIEPDVENLTKGRRTILFVHGVFSNANSWILMGVWKGKPHDWSKEDVDEIQLKSLIGNDQTSRAMPFLLSNFGFDVWLMNRRNTKQSRIISPKFNPNLKSLIENESVDKWDEKFKSVSKLTDLFGSKGLEFGDKLAKIIENLEFPKSSNPDDYFNYSYDEQAAFDAPIAINHILKVTKATKLDWVGHAAGCLIPLQMIARFPAFGPKRPTVNFLNLIQNNMKNLLVRVLNLLEVQFSTSLGALDPNIFLPLLLILEEPACSHHKAMNFPCGNPADEVFGYGTNQHDLSISANGLKSYAATVGFHELGQLGQSMYTNEVHYFNFRDVHKTKRAYGNYEIPIYNIANVTVGGSISIWRGNTDRLANQYDTTNLYKKLKSKNKVDFHPVGSDKDMVLFNHLGYLFHKDIVKLFNIPLLRRLVLAP